MRLKDETIFNILHNMDTFTNGLIIKWNKMFAGDLGVSHVLILGFLQAHGHSRPSAIAKELGLTPPTVTHLTEKLVKRELVERLPDENDRRTILLALTKEGEAILEQANEKGQALRKEMFTKLTEAEREELLRLFKKMNA